MTAVPVSIVIPTHNRRDAVVRALRALGTQTYPREATEVIVVADGCSDDTVPAAAALSPLPVRIIEQSAGGPAAARNRGAAHARGDLLIFLDDDIEVAPGFVAAHVEAHAEGNLVAIGYLPADVQGRRDFFGVTLRGWWERMFERMRDPGHRFAYSDLLSGNFSLRPDLFHRVGGFDESFGCHEDYELGFRLIEGGARFRFVPAAAGNHHEHTDLQRALRRKRDEGRADVALARKHPQLAHALPLALPQPTRRGRALQRLAMTNGVVGDRAAGACRGGLRIMEAGRLRTRWRRLLYELLSYWYWRGVAESLDGEPLARLVRFPAPSSLPELDLKPGFGPAAAELDAVRPSGVTLRWGSQTIASIPSVPGMEPFEGRHVRSLLAGRFAERFARAMAAEELRGGSAIPSASTSVIEARLTARDPA